MIEDEDLSREELEEKLTENVPSLDDLRGAFSCDVAEEDLKLAQTIFEKQKDVFLAWYDLKDSNKGAAQEFLRSITTMAMNQVNTEPKDKNNGVSMVR